MTHIHLNGWRRLGVVFAVLWVLGVTFIASFGSDTVAYELVSNEVVETRMFPVPASELKETLEAETRRKFGRELKPWEMEWNPTKLAPAPLKVRERHLSPLKILLVAVVWPAVFWILCELLVRVGLWVKAGFRSHAAVMERNEEHEY